MTVLRLRLYLMLHWQTCYKHEMQCAWYIMLCCVKAHTFTCRCAEITLFSKASTCFSTLMSSFMACSWTHHQSIIFWLTACSCSPSTSITTARDIHNRHIRDVLPCVWDVTKVKWTHHVCEHRTGSCTPYVFGSVLSKTSLWCLDNEVSWTESAVPSHLISTTSHLSCLPTKTHKTVTRKPIWF